MATPGSASIESAPVLGVQPWFLWPLSRWKWLNQPVRAERLAALRIGIGMILLLDLLTTQWPMAATLYSREGLRPQSQYSWRFDPEKHPQRWSLLEKYDSPGAIYFFMSLWTAGAVLVTAGCFTRLSIAATWVLNVSFLNCNDSIDNAGDMVRQLALFFLLLGRSGAAWSVDSWFRRRYRWVSSGPLGSGFLGLGIVPRRRAAPYQGPFYIYPWVLRLVFIQMIVIYAFNGIAKACGDTWHNGTSLYHVLCDLSLARFSYAMLPTPMPVIKVLTIMVLWWEMLFLPMMLVPWRWIANQLEKPFRKPMARFEDWYFNLRAVWRYALSPLASLVLGWPYLIRWAREIMLVFGALFHVGILFTMEIGFFAPYMLCLYLPLLPWEWWVDRRVQAASREPVRQTDPVIVDSQVSRDTESSERSEGYHPGIPS